MCVTAFDDIPTCCLALPFSLFLHRNRCLSYFTRLHSSSFQGNASDWVLLTLHPYEYRLSRRQRIA